MTDQEKADLKQEIAQASTEAVAAIVASSVTQALIDAELIPDPAATVVEDAPIAFEGDPSKREDVEAHQAKLASAEAGKIMASGDAEAIKKHLASLTPATPAASKQPAGNFEGGQSPNEENEETVQNRKDTEDILMSVLPKG